MTRTACVVSALGEVVDAIGIGAIVVLNTLVGFFQSCPPTPGSGWLTLSGSKRRR